MKYGNQSRRKETLNVSKEGDQKGPFSIATKQKCREVPLANTLPTRPMSRSST